MIAFTKWMRNFLHMCLNYVFVEVDHCDPNPCFHGGTCQIINGGVGYMCSCPEGYKGQMCEGIV